MLHGPHALARADERLTAAGLDPKKVYAKGAELATVTSKYWYSAAVLMVALDRNYGDTNAPRDDRDSNGNEVWAVCRGGKLVTLMLRRDTQPKTCDAFGVDKVLRMTK